MHSFVSPDDSNMDLVLHDVQTKLDLQGDKIEQLDTQMRGFEDRIVTKIETENRSLKDTLKDYMALILDKLTVLVDSNQDGYPEHMTSNMTSHTTINHRTGSDNKTHLSNVMDDDTLKTTEDMFNDIYTEMTGGFDATKEGTLLKTSMHEKHEHPKEHLSHSIINAGLYVSRVAQSAYILETKNDMRMVKSYIEETRTAVTDLKASLDGTKTKIEELFSEVQETHTKMDGLVNSVQSNSTEINKVESILQETKVDIKEINQNVKDYKVELQNGLSETTEDLENTKTTPRIGSQHDDDIPTSSNVNDTGTRNSNGVTNTYDVNVKIDRVSTWTRSGKTAYSSLCHIQQWKSWVRGVVKFCENGNVWVYLYHNTDRSVDVSHR